ncbi:MAG: hypothetical protein AAB839_00590 [Patescibacteria group bacterium]
MERKTKIEIGLAIAVILLFFAMLVVWLRQPPVVTTETSTSPTTNIKTSTTKPTTTTTTTMTDTPAAPVVKETSAITVARTFVERFGSYSTEADAENLEDILPMATPSFQQELVELARKARASADGTYYGVSTIVVTAPKTVSATATETVLSMTTQREETKDTPGNTSVIYQSITVTLVKSGTTWLVSGYSWQ